MTLVIFTRNESLFAFKLCLMSILTCLACSYLPFASGLKHLVSPSSKIWYEGFFAKLETNLLSLSLSDISVSPQIIFCGCFLLSPLFSSVCFWPNTKQKSDCSSTEEVAQSRTSPSVPRLDSWFPHFPQLQPCHLSREVPTLCFDTVIYRRLFCMPRDAAAPVIFSDLISDSLLNLVQRLDAPAQRSPGRPVHQETLKASALWSDTGMVTPGSGNKQHHRAALAAAPERFESSAEIWEEGD